MITLLRHTQSLTNFTHNDQLNPPLTKKGIKDAQLLSGHYDFILISPLLRTEQTYLYSNLTGIIVEYSTLCREKRGTHAYLSKTLKNEKGYIEGEDGFNFRMYLLKLYLDYLRQHYKRILVITHHGVIMALTGQHAYNGDFINYN